MVANPKLDPVVVLLLTVFGSRPADNGGERKHNSKFVIGL
jgi:hypothetical protein